MCRVCFQFLASVSVVAGSHTDAKLAAAILANSFSRQGLKATAEGSTVMVEAPDSAVRPPETIYVLLDERVLADPNWCDTVDRRSAVVIGTARPAGTLLQELGRFSAGVTVVDAEGIAVAEGSDAVIALLGGTARTVPFIDPETLGVAVWTNYDRTLPYSAQAAMRTFDLGYTQAQHA